MKIRKLPTLLINQIAAGEVIERPASIVKECVENSIDAQATQIDIAIEQGGHQLIRISDNGLGIAEDELELAVSPHATSKLHSPDQLAAIGTLGFRGEALASISSVSRTKITSRPTRDGKAAEAAAVLEVEGSRLSPPYPAACAPGTIIDVRDLFFNTPARRKFLRQPSTEFAQINEIVTRIAMCNHNIGFRLTHNDRKITDLPPNQTRAQRVISLVGKDIKNGLLEFSHEDLAEHGGATLWGMAGLPEIARATNKFLYLCINGRVIKDRNLIHAVREAYRGLIPPEKTPVAAVFIEMPAEDVDVNVHPSKAEVRFRKPKQYFGLVRNAIRQCLLDNDLMPTAKLSDDAVPAFRPVEQEKVPETEATQAFVDYFKKMAPKQKGFAYQEVQRAIQTEVSKEAPLLNDTFTQAVSEQEVVDTETGEVMAAANDAAPILAAEPQGLNLTPVKILQIHNSFVVTEDDQGIVIIDQHALHERIMFEKLTARVLGTNSGAPKSLESQRLLMPEIIEASQNEQELLEELKPLLVRLGIEVEPIGPHVVALQAFPSFLYSRKVEAVPFMRELIDKSLEGAISINDPAAEENALHEVLDMMSCKAAIKAGDNMTEDQLAELLAQKDKFERTSNCPHGRPTTLRLTLKDLYKQFGR
ncbi:DNA mismatch repair protein MutL [Poriferisphaera corsica]|uniref:DNA mismatch repair protein MutL n=1 Tax=Poriferisphaera corsica TaxID=2528020 RepID=A0A517YRC1_9BACT|nr:DNA mismatch repair endonuclease MutL [Poriferisphaera corsica]QDU32776.1 DNA mismatch repair protein MutL [Poriferisphaera corsica]